MRYATLYQSFPEEAEKLHSALEVDYKERYQKYKAMAGDE